MRGKELFYGQFIQSHGITPAYAGKSAAPALPFRSCQDHPRLCGEKESGCIIQIR